MGVGAALAACGASPARALKSPGPVRRGGVASIGVIAPTATPDPVTLYDAGSEMTVQCALEYLAWPRPDYTLEPRLATSWSSSSPAEWTVYLREGVNWQSGKAFTADDVVYTFKMLTDPALDSAALSAFQGILSPGGVSAIDSGTVRFRLDRPYVDFPYLLSAFNINAFILPVGYKVGDFIKGGVGTGPFRLTKYLPGQSATFVRNPAYWAKGLPRVDGVNLTYYASSQAMVVAMQGGVIDVYPQLTYTGSQALFGSPGIKILENSSSSYRTLQMRVDEPPFDDSRVRQALALCLDRPAIVRGLLGGHAQVGNDHGFAPVFPLSRLAVQQVPQRSQNYPQARALMAQAGHGHGLDVTLTVPEYLELASFGQIVQQQALPAGFRISLDTITLNSYYGSGSTQPWLQVPFGITSWAERGTPSQLLTPAYTCRSVPNATLSNAGAAWNSAHWCDPAFDRALADMDSDGNLTSRGKLAATAARIQQDATPDIIAYWLNDLRAVRSTVHGVASGPSTMLDLRNLWLG